ncbi:hemin import ATP-binding protein HmuV [Bacterioplanes sanyensis]|uniref:ABC transporter ATP-binding protein n=1 Tax=Bacterioplanes sanyensis TaxID=1249553 RepID=UPI0016718A5B|nr:ATP-binding cassette domain-containing protein [Bacterioplanes sanyensis]GGY38840.1 hemin import ATP-binding protein HmuV [Bacterioplanes sanyensis]
MVMQLHNIGVNRGAVAIVDGIELSVRRGEILMLLGPNGAGKSTLLQVMAGLESPSRGELKLDGEQPQHWSRQQWANTVSFLPQLSALSFPLTVAEVVALGSLNQQSVVHERQALQQALQYWDIDYLAQQQVRWLSGGEQQRVQLARSWLQAQQGQLWLLDEPLSALDLRHQKQCLQLARDYASAGKAVVMVIHDLNLAWQCADRVALLCCGRLMAQGTPEQVLKESLLSEVFEVPVSTVGGVIRWR